MNMIQINEKPSSEMSKEGKTASLYLAASEMSSPVGSTNCLQNEVSFDETAIEERDNRTTVEQLKLHDPDRLSYIMYWKRRHYFHELSVTFKSTLDEYLQEPLYHGELTFDWERYVLNLDQVLKFRKVFKLNAVKPRVLKYFYARNGSKIIIPFQTWFCDNNVNADPESIMYESFSMTAYDERTHYKFKFREFEAALRITKHIWTPRIKMMKSGKSKWNLIYQICFDFLSSWQTRKNGYTRELQKKFEGSEVSEIPEQIQERFVCEEFIPEVEPQRYEAIIYSQTAEHSTESIVQEEYQTACLEENGDYLDGDVDKRYCGFTKRAQVKETWHPKKIPGRKCAKRRMRKPYQTVTRTFFQDLAEVYYRIGRPDLAFKIGMPARYNWYISKQRWRLAGNELRKNIEAQSGCVDKGVRDKAVRVLSQVQTTLRKHYDKVFILSHRGRFIYLTKWDEQIYYKQQVTLKNMLTQVNQISTYFKTNIINLTIPSSYVEEADCVLNYVTAAINNSTEESLNKAFSACTILQRRWLQPFDFHKCFCIVPQSGTEEKPNLGASAPSPTQAVGVTQSVAKLDEPIVTGEKEVTITMVDQRESDTATVPDLKTGIQKKTATPEGPYKMPDTVERPMFIDRQTWKVGQEIGTNIATYVLPNVYFDALSKAPTVCQNLNASYILSMFGSCKFDMKVKIQANTVKFQQGMLIAAFKPFYDTSRAVDIFNNIEQYPHVKINASKSNPVEMTIPWTHFRDAFPIYSDSHAEYNYFGTFHIFVWNELETGETSSSDASISVWMWLENLATYQLTNPKAPSTVRFASDILGPKTEASSREVIKTMHRVITAGTYTPQSGIVDELITKGGTMATEMGVDLVEGLLSKFLKGHNKKPGVALPPLPMKPEITGNTAHGEGVDTTSRLSLHPVSTNKPLPETFRDVNMKELMKKWSRIRVATWDSTDAENTTLLKIPVLPMINSVKTATIVHQKLFGATTYDGDICTVVNSTFRMGVQRRYGCMLDYLSRLFYYWRGSLRYQFEVVCTDIHSGRLLIRYEPYASEKSANLECQKMATPGINWDVQENHILEMKAPFMSLQNYLSTFYISEGGIIDRNLSECVNGIIEISVINKLKVTPGISGKVSINVSLAADDDFHFSVPATLDGIFAIRYNSIEDAENGVALRPENQILMDALWRGVQVGLLGKVMEPYVEKIEDKGKIIIKFKDLSVTSRAFVPGMQYKLEQSLKIEMIEITALALQNAQMNYDNIKDFNTAFSYLESIQNGYVPANVDDMHKLYEREMGKVDRSKMLCWMAIVLCKGNLDPEFEVPLLAGKWWNWLDKSVERKFRDIEPQSKTCKNAAINPFVSHIPPQPEENMMGEDFMDMYVLMKRWNEWTSVNLPPTLGKDARSQEVKRQYFGKQLEDMSMMGDAELDQWFLEYRIPVTPFLPYHTVGDAHHTFVNSFNKGKQASFYAYRLPIQPGNADSGDRASLVHSRYFGELFTFWRGSMRYKFVIPKPKHSQGVWSAQITYHPRTYTPYEVGLEQFSIVSKERVRQHSKMGNVLFTGNVMGAIDVETPYYSKFGMLYLNDREFTEYTTSGSLIINVPIIRSAVGDCKGGITQLTADTIFESFSFNLWVSIGEDMRFNVSRAAPVQYLWPRFFSKTTSDKNVENGYADITELTETVRVAQSNWPGQVEKHVHAGGSDQITEGNPIKSYLTLQKYIAHRNPAEEFTLANKIKLNSLSYGGNKKPVIEPQMGSDSEEESTITSENEITTDDVDGMITDIVKVTPEILRNFKETVGEVNTLLSSIKETNVQAKETLATMKEKSETTSSVISSAMDKVGNTASYALDGVRLAVFFKGIMEMIKAETWSERWIPLATSAIALGLSAEVVTEAGKWLISWFINPDSEKVHENVQQGGYEEEWDLSWPVFLEKHAGLLRFIAAGVVTIFAFVMTTTTPCSNKVSSFAGSMLNKLKNFAIVGTAFKTFDWMFKWLSSVITSAVVTAGDWISDGQVTAYQMSSHYPEIITWLREVETFKQEGMIAELTWNADARVELWKSMDAGETLLKKIGNKSGSLYTTIMRGLTSLNKSHAESIINVTVSPFRVDPYHVCLVGAPNVGKSAILTFILNFMCDAMRYPKKHRFYSRNETDDYWTKYCGQTCVIIDDIYSSKKGVAINELIKMKTNLSWGLNMAEVSEKGRPFTSKLIGTTTNVPYPQPQDAVCREAIWRRRNLLIHVERCRPADWKARAKDWQRDLKFSLLDPTAGVAGVYIEGYRDLDLKELMVLCADTFRHWIDVQNRLVFQGLSGEEIAVPEASPLDNILLVKTTADSFHVMVDREISMSESFVKSYLTKLDDREWEGLVIPERTSKLEKYESYKEECVRRKAAKQLHYIVSLIETNPLDGNICDLVSTWKNWCDTEEKVGFRILTPKVGPVNKKIRVNEAVGNQQYNIIAQSGDDSDYDDYERLEEIEALEIDATEALTIREKLGDAYTKLNPKQFLTKKRIRIANVDEIQNFVSTNFSNVSAKEREKLVHDFTKVFNAQQRRPVQMMSNTEAVKNYSELFLVKNLDKWKKEKNDWRMVFSENVATDDDEYRVYSLYMLMTEILEQEEINKLREAVKEDAVTKISKSTETVIKYLNNSKTKLQKWFDDHPKIKVLLKLAASLGAVFIGYKLVDRFFPGTIESLKLAFASLFGWGASKIGEDNIKNLQSKGRNIKEYTQTKFINVRDFVRNLIFRTGNKEMIEASASDEYVDLIAESMPRVMTSAKNLVALGNNRIPESKRPANPYMAANATPNHNLSDLKSYLLPLESQGSTDPTAMDLRSTKIMPNIVSLMYSKTGRKSDVNALFVKNRIMLAPYHFFEACEPGMPFIMVDLKGCSWWDTYQPERCVKLRDVDACVYACGLRVPQRSTILTHFPLIDEILLDNIKSTLNVFTHSGLVVHNVQATLTKEIAYGLETGEHMCNDLAWEYEASTSRGDCGAVLLANNTQVRHKILGIHVAGSRDASLGFSALIRRDVLTEAMSALPEISTVESTNIIPQSLITKTILDMKVKPRGNFELFGAVAESNAVRLPHKTEIEKSLIHGIVRQPVTEPAILIRSDPRNLTGESPLLKAIEKYGKPTIPFNPYDLDYVSNYIQNKILAWPRAMEARLLTDWEAVFGNESILYLDKMNLSSAAGYPWIKQKPAWEKGKAWLFDVNSEDGIKEEEFRKEYITREKLAKGGIRKQSLWTDCLKDERRPLSKIQKASTRAFMIPPADFVMLCRKYLMSFCVTFYANHTTSFSGVGMDAYSFDWTKLVRRLCSRTNNGFGGDFHSYDGILDSDITWKICKIINEWYRKYDKNWSKEDDRVREVLFEEMIHTYHICLNSIYRDFQGNCSGNPITVILNTIAHKYYAAISFIGIQRLTLDEKFEIFAGILTNEEIFGMPVSVEYDLMHYDKFIRDVYYGDDGIQMVPPHLSHFFNLITMSGFLLKHGIQYTSEDKEGKLYKLKPIEQLTFLKNGFIKMRNRMFWHAPIARDTIYELTNWVKSSDDPIGQLKENILCAIKFAYFHGQEYFDEFLNSVNNALVSKGCEGITGSYWHSNESFLISCRG